MLKPCLIALGICCKKKYTAGSYFSDVAPNNINTILTTTTNKYFSMNKIIAKALLGLLFVLGTISANAQVDVTATGGTLAASYTTLKGAFDAINLGTHTGTITIGISGNTTEAAPAVLNASGSRSDL